MSLHIYGVADSREAQPIRRDHGTPWPEPHSSAVAEEAGGQPRGHEQDRAAGRCDVEDPDMATNARKPSSAQPW